MKILYCSGTPLAGVSELMGGLVKQYYPEHQARVLSAGAGKHRWYRRDGWSAPWFSIRDTHQRNECLEWADVVHCMANVSARSMGRLDLLDKKVWVFQWHGAQIWPFERVWLKQDFPKVKWIHIGQGWDRHAWFDKFRPFGLKIVPNIISIHDPIHKPLPWSHRKRQVAFAPSNMKTGAVNKKGIPEVRKACQGLIDLNVIHNMPFDECMRAKQKAFLGIDEVVTPLYHRSGLEFLAQGVPCICSHDSFTLECLKAVTGSNIMPFFNADPSSLRSVINDFMKLDENEKIEISIKSRKWMETYYDPKNLLLRYFDVYTQ